ncbi:MAG: hypothetical protein JXA99_03530 [Candidatus Lokiarchaeota archaeon]|nr:hypothetical protein [Candidatus Lokiarchaeota archaeon]
MKDVFKITFPISISTIISIIFGTYRSFFQTPLLEFELKESYNYLIDIFDVENNNTTAIQMNIGDRINPFAKYIRINLKNIGKTTAKNCRLKIYIYFKDGELVREPSNLYPSGFHQFKKERKPPPFVDIAAGDSQIFDICSTSNIHDEKDIIRFEDFFNYSRVQAKNNPLIMNHNNLLYITIYAYSDNNKSIKENYMIFKDSFLEGNELWEILNIKKINWPKHILRKDQQNHDLLATNQPIKKKISIYTQTYTEANPQDSISETNRNQDSSDHNYSTGLTDK